MPQITTLENYLGTTGKNIVIDTGHDGRPRCLSVVGTLGAAETIPVEIPKVLAPDPATDGDWQPLVLKQEAVALSSTNLAEAILVGLVVRIKIPVTVAAVGVRWS